MYNYTFEQIFTGIRFVQGNKPFASKKIQRVKSVLNISNFTMY